MGCRANGIAGESQQTENNDESTSENIREIPHPP